MIFHIILQSHFHIIYIYIYIYILHISVITIEIINPNHDMKQYIRHCIHIEV